MKIARIRLTRTYGSARRAPSAPGPQPPHRTCPGCHAPLGPHETVCRQCEAVRRDLDEADCERFEEGWDE
jgi:predicted amidophosphoribosyltransferase